MEENFLIKKEDSTDSSEYLINRRNNKKKKIIMIIGGILLLIAIILVIVLVSNNGQKEDNKKENDNNQTIVTKSWKDYLVEQDITSIKLLKHLCGTNDINEVELTIDQLKELSNRMLDYKIVKQYLADYNWNCGYQLEVSYLKNEKEYKMEIFDNVVTILPDYQDDDLLKLLDDSKESIENEDMKDDENVIYQYYFKDFDVMIFEEYL